MGYTEYWGLKEKPFEELCDTRFFFKVQTIGKLSTDYSMW